MWVLLGVVALALVLPSLWPSSSGEKITYTQFMDQVRAGKVESITVNNSSNTITGKLEDGTDVHHDRRRRPQPVGGRRGRRSASRTSTSSSRRRATTGC